MLGDKPQPQCILAQDHSPFLFLPETYAPHMAKEALDCLWLRGHFCLAGGLRSWKPTPKVFSLAENADLA